MGFTQFVFPRHETGSTDARSAPHSWLDDDGIESWHSTLEFELRSCQQLQTRTEAHRRVAAWIEEYDHNRRHSALGMTAGDEARISCMPLPLRIARRRGLQRSREQETSQKSSPVNPFTRRARRGAGRPLRGDTLDAC